MIGVAKRPPCVPSDVTVRRVTDVQMGSTYALELSLGGSTDKITVNGFFYSENPRGPYNPVQQVKFADGTTWSIDAILAQLYAVTSGNDSTRGTVAADVISGQDGNDSLYGGDGDDTLLGGRGNDGLYGEAGSDRLEVAISARIQPRDAVAHLVGQPLPQLGHARLHSFLSRLRPPLRGALLRFAARGADLLRLLGGALGARLLPLAHPIGRLARRHRARRPLQHQGERVFAGELAAGAGAAVGGPIS